jgi:hypothetical protein
MGDRSAPPSRSQHRDVFYPPIGECRVRLPAQDAIEWPRQSLRVPSDLAGRDSTSRGLCILRRLVWFTNR